VENVLNRGAELFLVTAPAAIDLDPMEPAAIEEAEVAVANRAHDAPVIDMAANSDQNC
jgi:hypothetical protein